MTLDIDCIVSEGNVRNELGDLNSLVMSIDRLGMLQPIRVTTSFSVSGTHDINHHPLRPTWLSNYVTHSRRSGGGAATWLNGGWMPSDRKEPNAVDTERRTNGAWHRRSC